MKKLFKVLFYIALVFAILFGAGIFLASSFSGNSPEWKKQVEEIASGIVRKNVRIGELHEAKIFPNMQFEGEFLIATGTKIENLEDMEADIRKGSTVLVRRLEFSVPFWSVFVGQPAVTHFKLEGLAIAGNNDFLIESAVIETPENDFPRLRLKGVSNAKPLDIWIELAPKGKGYIPTPDSKFQAIMNDAEIDGFITPVDNTLEFSSLNYTYNNNELSGMLDMYNDDKVMLLTLNRNDEVFIEVKSLAPETEVKDDSGLVADISDDLIKNILVNFCSISQQEHIIYSVGVTSNEQIRCFEVISEDNEKPVAQNQSDEDISVTEDLPSTQNDFVPNETQVNE